MTAQPQGLRTGHVGLNVSDLSRAVNFYRRVFELDLLEQSDNAGKGFAFLGRGSDIVLTLWRQSAGAAVRDRPGLHHLSFQFDTIEQVREAEVRVRALGARIHHDGIVSHAEGRTSGGLFFEDPDGIRLEIFAGLGADTAPAPYGNAPTCGFF